jgi:hypothetical protein
MNLRRSRPAAGIALAAAAALGQAGCGGPRTAEVIGTVRYQGKPVPFGRITFIADDGRMEAVYLKSDGTYRIPRAPVGKVRITVWTPSKALIAEAHKAIMAEATRPSGYHDPTPEGGFKRAPEAEEQWQLYKQGKVVAAPSRYHDPAISGLTYEVKTSSPQTFDLDLQP